MLFVPLPLFATLLLLFLLLSFVRSRDMSLRAHQLLAALIAAYGVQSLFLCLRWGYGIEKMSPAIAILAPLLPAFAYLAYRSLSGTLRATLPWITALVVANWAALFLVPDVADALLLVTYLGLGILILWQARSGPDQLATSPIGETSGILTAMQLIGGALIASAMTDLYVIYDFVRHDGRNIGLIVTFAQTAFILVIVFAATFGRASASPAPEIIAAYGQAGSTPEDAEIISRVSEAMVEGELYKDEDLSLRKLARKLNLPDRDLSQAINRVEGVNVSKFVNGFRIKKACDLLQTSNRSILEISLAVGFGTKSNFNREFVRVTGVSPSDWRERKAAN